MTLERYDVESCGESLIVRKLSLSDALLVFTPLLFDCKPGFLINNSACHGSASISIRSDAVLKRRHNPQYHTAQKSYFT